MKLHLGCGVKRLEGFVNVDLLSSDSVDLVANISKLPYNDDSVDLIYASHVLEHFGRYEYKKALQEWYRVLRYGGVVRLAVPDFEACAKLYSQGELQNGISDILGLVCGGQRNEFDYHKIIFDEASLTDALREIGFCNISRWEWRATEHSFVDDYSQAYLPHLDKQNGNLMSLNLQAIKI